MFQYIEPNSMAMQQEPIYWRAAPRFLEECVLEAFSKAVQLRRNLICGEIYLPVQTFDGAQYVLPANFCGIPYIFHNDGFDAQWQAATLLWMRPFHCHRFGQNEECLAAESEPIEVRVQHILQRWGPR